MTTRDDDWQRVSAAAGLDENGGILPQRSGATVNRAANPWWKNRVGEQKKQGANAGANTQVGRQSDLHKPTPTDKNS